MLIRSQDVLRYVCAWTSPNRCFASKRQLELVSNIRSVVPHQHSVMDPSSTSREVESLAFFEVNFGCDGRAWDALHSSRNTYRNWAYPP